MNKLPVVYILGPYTVGDVGVNVSAAMDVFDQLMDSGLVVPICPHWNHFQHMHRPRPKAEWLRWCYQLIPRVDAGVRIPGESTGSEEEEKIFEQHGLPIFWPLSACLEWAQNRAPRE